MEFSEKQASKLKKRNPDVLTCIANLSNDEVFTPPELTKQILDNLAIAWGEQNNGDSLWKNKKIKFLDPCSKSGIFLREIAVRLIEGLKEEIPDLEDRVNHILTKQIFGIAITELTSLLSRRSVYCSKNADSEHSIARSFKTKAGNIWFERIDHKWVGGKCKFCNAPASVFDRKASEENHAYGFLHCAKIEERIREIFGKDMQFDVIIGNPPYQLACDGGTRDLPIYQKFVEQAKALSPRFLTMVIPSRWMASGLGLKDFRQTMLSDRRIKKLVDYPNAAEIFPSVGINGGACYFLWDASHDGKCEITSIRAGVSSGSHLRFLDEFDVLVRDNRGLEILRKVQSLKQPSVNQILARDKEFGWTSNFDGFAKKEDEKSTIPLHYIRRVKRGIGYISRSKIQKSTHLIDTWKLLVPAVGSGREREKSGVDIVLGPSLIASNPSVCTQSFLFFYAESKSEVESIQSYYKTKFFRFLVSLRKITQHATHSTYEWVPMQEWNVLWNDAALYSKYKLNEEEINYIESLIRPME
ncbi:Eco57I restriction-modification methylase domain-containing protein [bacterium]|nr:Eco57I restriction-modification methylase domain-containing protein [bacterium]